MMQEDSDASQDLDLQAAVLWLLDVLDDTEPHLVSQVQEVAKLKRIRPALLRRAARAMPIIKKPRELRGPWTWRLPKPDELVRVRYTCPITECSKVSEGWMVFRISRLLFAAGLVRYLTRGTTRLTQPPDGETIFLR